MVDSDSSDMAQAASEAAASLRLVLAECDQAASPMDRVREAYLRGALHALESLTASDGASPERLSGDWQESE